MTDAEDQAYQQGQMDLMREIEKELKEINLTVDCLNANGELSDDYTKGVNETIKKIVDFLRKDREKSWWELDKREAIQFFTGKLK